MGFSRQEYWSGLPFLLQGNLLNPEIEPTSPVSCTARQLLYHQHHLGIPERLGESKILIYNFMFLIHSVTSFGEGNGTPLQYSCLENPMDRGAWQAAVHKVAKSQTRLSNFTFAFHFHALEKEMATHSNVLAWRIPGMGEPGGLPSMGWHRVGQD